MKMPTEPKQEDCCNSGCNPCIFDVYMEQLQAFRSYIANGKNDSLLENAISQLEYSKFQVLCNIDLKNQHRLILFKQANTTSYMNQVIWNPGDHFLFKYIFEDIACTRAYTPVKIKINESENYDFAIIVKRYMNGVVSNYLCDLKLGEVTLWRGPYGHFKLVPNKYCRIIMIAQGTGITPLHSIIKQVLNNDEDITKIVLLYCCQNIETILLREELYTFKSYWNFYYNIHLSDNIPDNYSFKYQEPIVCQRMNFNNLDKFKPFSENDLFILCGSKNFMDNYKQFLITDVRDENIVTF